jgi:hypothetical protein
MLIKGFLQKFRKFFNLLNENYNNVFQTERIELYKKAVILEWFALHWINLSCTHIHLCDTLPVPVSALTIMHFHVLQLVDDALQSPMGR